MRETFVRHLKPVRRRCQARSIVQTLALGMIAGSVACILVTLALPRLGGRPVALALLVAGPALGAIIGLTRRPSWRDTAALVDDHYRWQDSTTSALEFSAESSPAPFEALQIRKALQRLSEALPGEVVPLRPPRGWPLAAGSLAIALAILTWPLVARTVQGESANPLPFQAALDEARELEADARRIEIAAREEKDPALEAMLAAIRRTIEELKQPGLDMRQTMTKLSALEAAIAAQQKEMNIAVVDRQLQLLGSALAEAKPLEASGQMMQEARFGQAAQELEKAGDASIAEGEARTVEQMASKSAKEMQAKGLDKLGQATQKLAEGVKQGGGPSLKQGTKDLAKEIRDHERRRRINKLMAQEQKRLQDCKDRCEARNLLAKKQENDEASKNDPSKGKSATEQAAAGSARKDGLEAEKTAFRRDRQDLQGKAGEGPSETESQITGEGERRAAWRPSPKVHQKYERLSEAALEQEPIPLGHRRSIRRYFELIRPASGADPAVTPPPSAEGTQQAP